MIDYIKDIWKARFFWTHLAKSDLKYKFRRSKLGILWTLLNPLMLTLLMTLIFGTVFDISYGDYAPYILSGLIVWELLTNSVVAGGTSILVGESYIRQFKQPVSIYPLKSAIVNIASFLIGIIGFVFWVLFTHPENIILGMITLPLSTILYFMLIWPIVIISGFINTKYRDYPQVMTLVMQALWYVSPVFFSGEMFRANIYLEKFFYLNPITHILNLVREPFLFGRLPLLADYVYTLGMILVFMIFAIIKIKRDEKDIIFYL